MGKQESKQGDAFSYQFRYQKMVQGSDPAKVRRMSGGVYQFELFHGLRSNSMKLGSFKGGKRHNWMRKHFSSIVFTLALMGFLFLLDSLMGSIFEPSVIQTNSTLNVFSTDKVCVRSCVLLRYHLSYLPKYSAYRKNERKYCFGSMS